MSGSIQNNEMDVELGPPAADYRAPPPYEPMDCDDIMESDNISITDLEVEQLTSQSEYRQQVQQVGNQILMPPLPAPLLPPPLPATLPATVLAAIQPQVGNNTLANDMHAIQTLPTTLSPSTNNDNDIQQQQQQQQQHQQLLQQQLQHQQQQQQQQQQFSDGNQQCGPQQHGKLPTYEEVQMQRSLNGELPPNYDSMLGIRRPLPPSPPPNPLLVNFREAARNVGRNTSSLSRNTSSPADSIPSEDDELNNTTDNHLLGTDVMFVAAFLVAFIFNWIGFLMLTCFCHTVAARYGALSGFGLSLAKWTLIVKHSTDLASHENTWLWWLIMAFGFLICIRALVHYVSIKRTWRMMSTNAQERLLFFY